MPSRWRDSDPWTSRVAGDRDFRNKRETALLLASFCEEPFTSADIERLAGRTEVKRFFSTKWPVGTCPWKRLQECKDWGMVEVLRDETDQVRSRLELHGQPRQLYRITDAGHTKVRELERRLES